MRRNAKWSLVFLSLSLLSCASKEIQKIHSEEKKPAAVYDYHDLDSGRRPASAFDLSSNACKKFEDLAVKKMNTEGLIVVQKGQTVFEWYNQNYNAETRHPLWSASKTVLATVAAAAIQEGRLSLEDKVSKYLPGGNPNPFYDEITIGQLIDMTSGYDWKETYEGSAETSSIIAMLYGEGALDQAAYALKVPMRAKPGTEYNYSGGNTSILSKVLKVIYKEQYSEAPWRLLFNPLGMDKIVMEKDRAGTYLGAANVYATPREMAKIGALYLNNGFWRGKQILPPDYVEKARELNPPQQASQNSEELFKKGLFGRSIWLNKSLPDRKLKRQFKGVPTDAYLAFGHQGQSIVVLPSQEIVIARTGFDQQYWGDWGSAVRQTLRCFDHEAADVEAQSEEIEETAQ